MRRARLLPVAWLALAAPLLACMRQGVADPDVDPTQARSEWRIVSEPGQASAVPSAVPPPPTPSSPTRAPVLSDSPREGQVP